MTLANTTASITYDLLFMVGEDCAPMLSRRHECQGRDEIRIVMEETLKEMAEFYPCQRLTVLARKVA